MWIECESTYERWLKCYSVPEHHGGKHQLNGTIPREVYLALVLLVSHPEFDIRVTEAIGIHGLELATFDQTDADYTSPKLSFFVHF